MTKASWYTTDDCKIELPPIDMLILHLIFFDTLHPVSRKDSHVDFISQHCSSRQHPDFNY